MGHHSSRTASAEQRLAAPDVAGERGISLLLALTFLLAVGVMVAALITYADTGVKSAKNFRFERTIRYAADSALENGIAWAKDQPKVGIDDVSAEPCALNQAATSTAPAMLVTCEAKSGGGSGLPVDVGAVPEYSILTLGQRDHEPPSLNGSSCIGETGNKGWDPFGLRGSNRTEYGIRFSKSTTLCVSTRAVNSWQVKGKVFSNSQIMANAGGGATLADASSSIQARGGCINMACTDPGRTNQDPMQPSGNSNEGQDPRTDSTATAAERAEWALPSLTGMVKRSVPDASACTTSNTVIFEPGWYDDANAMNALFADGRCKGKTFWFAPARGTDGALLGPGYKQGLYYFDFTVNSNQGCNWYDNSDPETKHVWCVGDAYDFNQRVSGGTPLGWSPFGAGGSTQTVPMTTSSVDAFGTTFWSPSGNATKIDGASATYTNTILAIDRPITLQNFQPKVPAGAYNSSSFNIKVAHATSNSYNRPTVTVSYDSSLFGSRTCGTYRLNNGTFTAASPDQLSAADQSSLALCLNQGDKINTVKVRWNVSGCNFFCGGTRPTLDGISLFPDSYPDQPKFPDSKSCDETKPGVQFIFGGDSHLYVADGEVELCAGPAAQNPLTSQQIAFYGVPAEQPMRPSSVNRRTDGNTTGGGDYGNAVRIGEPAGSDRGDGAFVQYGIGNCGFCAETISGNLDLNYSALPARAGLRVKKVTMRASYNSHGIITGPEIVLPCASGTQTVGLPASHGIPQIDGFTQQSRDVTSCMKDRVTSGSFTPVWKSRALVVCAFGICGTRNFTDHLDGVEFLIDWESTTPSATSNPTPVPNGGCLIGAPNYWGASQGGDGTCAIIQADQTKNPFNSNQNSRGRFSAKGTVYVPSGAVSIDDEDVNYPFFGRGLVARTLMFRGFRYRNVTPIADIPVIDRSQKPREVTFRVCTRPGLTATDTRQCGTVAGDKVLARAKVRYEPDRSATMDPMTRARVPKVVWWSADR